MRSFLGQVNIRRIFLNYINSFHLVRRFGLDGNRMELLDLLSDTSVDSSVSRQG